MKDEYTQTEVIHCPIKGCKGMLLSNPYKQELKCSNCDKYFMRITEFVEVKPNDNEIK